jgi:hypothetical protein
MPQMCRSKALIEKELSAALLLFGQYKYIIELSEDLSEIDLK